jgi:pimeloyl-ACP methyl ester carboxylesterase
MVPFVLIPGLNSTARIFRDATEALWPLGSVTIADTLEGEGVTGMAEAILRDAPPKFALGGFSMGGYIGFEILRRAPKRVIGLALIDTTARRDTPALSETRQRRVEQARAGKFGLVVEQSFATSPHPDHVGDQRLKAIHHAMALSNGPEAYIRHQQAIIGRPDSRPMLASLTLPTVVVVGEADQTTPVGVAREMHEGIGGSRLVIVPEAGHLALLEQPEIVNAALVEWAGRLR